MDKTFLCPMCGEVHTLPERVLRQIDYEVQGVKFQLRFTICSTCFITSTAEQIEEFTREAAFQMMVAIVTGVWEEQTRNDVEKGTV